MLTPTGHSIKAIDLMAMKELGAKVNLIPVIAKSDAVGKDVIDDFKDKIVDDLEKGDVEIFEFPMDGEDEETKKKNEDFQCEIPFAVVGSKTVQEINGKTMRVRQY